MSWGWEKNGRRTATGGGRRAQGIECRSGRRASVSGGSDIFVHLGKSEPTSKWVVCPMRGDGSRELDDERKGRKGKRMEELEMVGMPATRERGGGGWGSETDGVGKRASGCAGACPGGS